MISRALPHQRWFPVFFIALVTAFSFIVAPGYESFVADQPIFLPLVYHVLDPTLFPNDLVWFEVMHTQRTLLTGFLVFFTQGGIPIPWVLFFLTLFFRGLFFASLYFVIRFLSNSRIYALFALLFFVTQFFIPGTGHATIETAFSYRVVALGVGMFSLALYLYGHRTMPLLFLVLGFFIHPITTVPFFMFFYLHMTWELWRDRAMLKNRAPALLAMIAPVVLIFIFLFSQASGIRESFFTVIDTEWKNLAKGRNDPFFFAFWNNRSFISLGMWAILTTLPLIHLKHIFPEKEKRILLVLLSIIPVLLLFIAGVGEYFMVQGIIQLNLQRGLLLMSILTPILIGIFTLWHVTHFPTSFLKNGLLTTIVFWFLIKENFIFLREQIVVLVPPMALLFIESVFPIFQRYKKLTTIFAALLTIGGVGVATYYALFYHDIKSLVVFYLLITCGFGLASIHMRKNLRLESVMTSALTGALLILIVVPLPYLSKFTIYPYFYADPAYRQACEWVQNNTPKDSIFIVEPFAFKEDPREFRLACFRPIFTAFRETAIPYEPRTVTFEWKHRQELERAMIKDWHVLKVIQEDYGVDYIFSEERLPIKNDVVFRNEKIIIYKL